MIGFLGQELSRFQCLLSDIPDWYRWNSSFVHDLHPTQICNIWDFSTKHPDVQRRSYPCDKESTRLLIGRFHMWSPRFSRSAMEITIIPPGNYLQHRDVYIQKSVFAIPFISRDNISLHAPCQIFVNRLARLGRRISHLINSNVDNTSDI
jgi:hypothetical protein